MFRIRWSDLIATLASFDPRLAPKILLAQVAFVVLGGLALWLLLAVQYSVRPLAFLAAYWRCVALGYWTPAAMGELSLAWFLRPHGVPLSAGLALMTMDKLVTLVAFSAFALPVLGPSVALLADGASWSETVALVTAIVSVGAVLLIALRGLRATGPALTLLRRSATYLRALRSLAFDAPARLTGNLILTLARVVVATAVLWWSIEAFEPRHSVPFARLLVTASAARLLALALPSPNGLGVYEVALVELLSPFRISAPGIVAGVLLSRCVALLPLAVGLLVPSPRTGSGPPPTSQNHGRMG